MAALVRGLVLFTVFGCPRRVLQEDPDEIQLKLYQSKHLKLLQNYYIILLLVCEWFVAGWKQGRGLYSRHLSDFDNQLARSQPPISR